MYNRDMAFTVTDYSDFIKLLREHPEWREELRREILDDEFLKLPEYVKQNSVDIKALQVVVAQNSADIRDLRAVVERLVAETTESRDASEARFNRIERHLADLRGSAAETKWREHAPGRFGQRLRKLRVVQPRDLVLFEDADQADVITPEQALAVRKTDLLIEGVEGRGAAQRPALLVVEISVGIEKHDIDRAVQRAEILRTVGYNAHAVVAGNRIAELTEQYAARIGVEVVLESPRDGQQSA